MMNGDDILNSDPKFQKPDQLEYHWYKTDEEEIRYAVLKQENSETNGTILLFPGLFECIEKYYETIHEMENRGLNVMIMDWPSQGLSTRYLDNKMKRYTRGFENELSLMDDVIQHTLKQHFDNASTPVYIMGHSFGGHMVLRYLERYHPEFITKAILSAPMLDIKIDPPVLKKLAPYITSSMVKLGAGHAYVPGEKDWTPDISKPPLSHDPVRKDLLRAWFMKDANLISCGPTHLWLSEALMSCRRLNDTNLSTIKTPTLFITAGDDHVVDNTNAQNIINKMQNSEHVTIEDAYHELLVEADEYRNQYWRSFDQFIHQ